jgi:hypothetical protein
MRKAWVILAFALALSVATSAQAAPYADPHFHETWDHFEHMTANFWGPAMGSHFEPYVDATGGQRLVQYFEKGRMEINDAALRDVSSGLLATELVTGNMQIGHTAFQYKLPPAIPIAGDPRGIGPTYRWLAAAGQALREPTQPRLGIRTSFRIERDGAIFDEGADEEFGKYALDVYHGPTRHNVMAAFTSYRNYVGLDAIGYAISEPFVAKFTVKGVGRPIYVQIFQRRVLTYNDANPDDFKIEFGNIGIHYVGWRYGA